MAMKGDDPGTGQGNKLCGAKTRGGGTCRKPAGAATPHPGFGRCALHGGSTPTQVIGAEKQRVVTLAREAVRKFEITPVKDPLTQLQTIAGELLAVKNWLRDEVERMNSLRYEGKAGEQIRGELIVYQTSLRDCTNVLATIIKLGIDDRLAKIEETRVNAIVQAIESGLADAGVTGDRALEIKTAVAGHLRLVA